MFHPERLFVLGFSNDFMKFWPEVNRDLVFHGIKHSIFLHMAGHIHKRKSSTGRSGFFSLYRMSIS